MNITTCSVTVMRSHDYCHFSVTLGSDTNLTQDNDIKLADVDALRKSAARLADKAVAQYKVAKANEARLSSEMREHQWELGEIERIKKTAETDRTPEQQATLKLHNDKTWHASRSFDYEDDWQDDGTDD